MVYQLIATDVAWDKKDKLFRLSNYLEKTINPDDTETLNSGNEKTQSFGLSPEELFPNDLEAENKNTPDLIKFIEREKIKGNSNLNTYLNELHQRTSMPVSIFILSILALSLSSQKRRGGIGQNLAVVSRWLSHSFSPLRCVKFSLLPKAFRHSLPCGFPTSFSELWPYICTEKEQMNNQ